MRVPSARTTYWLCQLGGWLVLALVAALLDAYAHPSEVLQSTFLTFALSAVGLLLTHLFRLIIHRQGLGSRDRPHRWMWISGGVAALTLIETTITMVGVITLDLHERVSLQLLAAAEAVQWTFIFSIWMALYFLVNAERQARQLAMQTLQLAVQARESELQALQAQVNPHFFFNSLNSLRALIYEDPAAAAGVVDQLATMMRYTLRSSRRPLVPLREELDAVQSYLAIETIRFESRIDLILALDPTLDEVMLPPMTLQTLVENAVKYGVEQTAQPTTVRIATRTAEGRSLIIDVANQGRLRSTGDSTGLGLANARKRLVLTCGPAAAIVLKEEAGWVHATVSIPGAAA